MSLTGVAFLLAYLGALGATLYKHPRFGLYTYLAVVYVHPPSRWWGESLPDLRWSLLAGVVTLLAMMRMPPEKQAVPWHSTTPAKLLIGFTLWVWVQNIWALAHPEHLELSILFTKYIFLYFIIYRLLDTPEEIGRVLFVHVIGCAYLGVLAYLAPEQGRLEGVGGPGIDEANALGMFVATGALCAGLMVIGDRSWLRWGSFIALPFALNTVVQSGSRGAVLGLIAGGLTALFLSSRTYRTRLFAAAVAGVFVFLAVAPASFWDRMLTLRAAVENEEEIDSSAESRIFLAKAQLQMAAAYPLGTGHRGTAVLSSQYLDERWLTKASADDVIGARSSHNTFLSALVEQGVLGLLIFVGFVIWLLRTVFALKRYARATPGDEHRLVLYGSCAAGTLVIVFIAGIFTDYLKSEVQIWMFAILSSILHVHLPRAVQRRAESVPAAGSARTTRARGAA